MSLSLADICLIAIAFAVWIGVFAGWNVI